MDPVVVGVVIFVIGLIISIMKTVVGIKNDKNTESMLQIIKKGTNQLSQIQEKQLLSSKEEAFREFMELVQKQLKKFSSYSCQNDENLQNLLDKTCLSISKLAINLNSDNYSNQEILHFFSFELEQFFTLLGNGPDFTVDKELYERLCSCLNAISKKATGLEENIKEWQNFPIKVKFDALIEYISK